MTLTIVTYPTTGTTAHTHAPGFPAPPLCPGCLTLRTTVAATEPRRNAVVADHAGRPWRLGNRGLWGSPGNKGLGRWEWPELVQRHGPLTVNAPQAGLRPELVLPEPVGYWRSFYQRRPSNGYVPKVHKQSARIPGWAACASTRIMLDVDQPRRLADVEASALCTRCFRT